MSRLHELEVGQKTTLWWVEGLAAGISHVLSPAGVAILVFSGILWPHGADGAMPLAVCISVFAGLPGATLLLLGSRTGQGDVYDPPPVLRQRFLLLGTCCYLAGYVLFEWLGLAPLLRWAAATFTAGAAAVWLVDRRWKISIHNTGAGGGAALLAGVVGPNLWPLCAVLPIVVGWARWTRRAHTVPQLVAGAALGAAIALLLRGAFV